MRAVLQRPNFVRFIAQVEHEVAQLRAGEQPDNVSSPKASWAC